MDTSSTTVQTTRPGRPATTPDLSTYSTTPSGCWEWSRYVDPNGYGRVYDPSMPLGQRMQWVHRVSYRVHVGPIAERHEIDHECQNTRCMNPAHLAMVTKAEHARRTMSRLGKDRLHKAAGILRTHGMTYADIATALGYADRGSALAAVEAAIAKGLVEADAMPTRRLLSSDQREDIRTLYAFGIPQTEIAGWYGVDGSQVSRICAGRTSGHDRRVAS